MMAKREARDRVGSVLLVSTLRGGAPGVLLRGAMG
jgi:hypothetical protein